MTLGVAIVLGSIGLILSGCPAPEETATPPAEDQAAVESTGDEAAEEHAHHGHSDSPFHADGVTLQVENLENGAAITYTAEDAELVTQLQEFAAAKVAGEAGGHGCKHDCPCKWEGVTRAAENLDNGVKLTLEAEDADLVAKLQAHMAKKAEGGGCGHGKGADDKPWAVLHSDAVTRTAENLDNGVKIDFTAGCPHLQGKLQEAATAMIGHRGSAADANAGGGCQHCDNPFHAEGVAVSASPNETGVAISYTTDDAELVTQLQEFAAKKVSGEGCDCEHE